MAISQGIPHIIPINSLIFEWQAAGLLVPFLLPSFSVLSNQPTNQPTHFLGSQNSLTNLPPPKKNGGYHLK